MPIESHINMRTAREGVDIDGLIRYLKAGELAFLVGAGISKNKPSVLPLWKELVISIIEALVGEAEATKVEGHIDELEHIEVLIQLLREQIGDSAYKPLQIALGSKEWNPLHLFLSWVTTHYKAPVLTPNMDILIETAGREVLDPYFGACVTLDQFDHWFYSNGGGVLKLHGSIENVPTMRVAINDLFIGLNPRIARCVKKILQTHHLLVLGYRGADEFDINPMLFRRRPDVKIFWLFHQGSREGASPLLRSRLERLALVDEVETSQFIKELCSTVARSGESMPPELVCWTTSSSLPCQDDKPLTSPSWQSELSAWADTIDPADRLTTWARILEYVGEYSEAALAYQSCVDATGEKPSLKRADALFRLGWLRRRVDPLHPPLHVFNEAKEEIDEITKAHPEVKSKALSLKGNVLHQEGRALQDANNFSGALNALKVAQSIRQELNDQVGVAFTKFQRFMLGERAQREFGESVNLIDSFAPEWQTELASDLEAAAQNLRRKGEIRTFVTMNHNIAFLYQFILDKEIIAFGRWEDALSLLSKVIRKYHIARRFRDRLYDPRERGITYARLAEAYKLKASIYWELNRRKSKGRACENGLRWSKKALEIFTELPDPERIRQVERVMGEIQTIYGDR
ncbi:MAG: SIR2 family protein [Dehalococcoidia bacterium]|nr:SIR2 family protein [Dehalococcoidia bacterium]